MTGERRSRRVAQGGRLEVETQPKWGASASSSMNRGLAAAPIVASSTFARSVGGNTQSENAAPKGTPFERDGGEKKQEKERNEDWGTGATPVKADKLEKWLEGYDPQKKRALIQGFREGFRVGFTGAPNSVVQKNLKSAEEMPEVVEAHIKREIEEGRLVGPFRHIPFTQFQCSPIGLVEKKTKGKYRMIHHLSHPKGASINDFIEEDMATVSYANVQDAVQLVQTVGNTAFMAKTDVEKAFRLLPIHPSDQNLFVLSWQGSFYVDLSLQMGCSSSCHLFEELGTALEWIAVQKLGIPLVHYLDDFFFAAVSKQLGKEYLDKFLGLCEEIGVPMAPDKTEGPETRLTFLGIEIDTIEREIRLPVEKLTKCAKEIQNLLQKKKATGKEIQSVIGLLNFACQAVVPGRAFLRRLIDLIRGIRSQLFFVRLNQGVKEDLKTWLTFLQSFNGKCFFLMNKEVSSEELDLVTDASGAVGYGALFGRQWFQGRWSDWWRLQNITLLELYPIVLALETWAMAFQNKYLVIHTDNLDLVSVITKQTSKEPLVMILVRQLVLCCLRNNIVVRAQHIAGVDNASADALSRFQMTRFRQLCPHAEPLPVGISPLPEQLGGIGDLESC